MYFIGLHMSEVQYPIRVDKLLKDTFISVCKENESTAAQELRKFMKDYIKKNQQQDMFKNHINK